MIILLKSAVNHMSARIEEELHHYRLYQITQDCVQKDRILQRDGGSFLKMRNIVERRWIISQNVKTLDLLNQFRKAGRFGLTGQRLAG